MTLLEHLDFYSNALCANEMDCVWHGLRGEPRRLLIAREMGHAARVACCFVAAGADEEAAKQLFKDILILRGRWHGTA